MKRMMVSLLVVLGVGCAVLRADTIPVDATCKVALVAYLNGRLQISLTGSTALTLTQCEIQYRAHGDAGAAWSETQTASFANLGPGGTDGKTGRYCSLAATLASNADVRFRALSASGSTDWIVQENVRVEPFPLTPATYTKSASYQPTDGLTVLRDGKQSQIIELVGSASEWIQFDLGCEQAIAGLRVLPRLAFPGRLAKAVIQVANDQDMTDAQTVIASTPAPGTPIDATDWAFPAGVRGRYIRVTSTSDYVDITEAEPYSDRPDAAMFQLAASQSAYNDPQPRLDLDAAWARTESWTVERAFASTGPWDVVSAGTTKTTSLVDAVPGTPSATYFYRARFTSRTVAGEPVEFVTPVVSFVYARTLERDWATDPATLLGGVSVLADCQASSAAETGRAFDGNMNLNNYVPTTANPLIGLDFGKACHIVRGLVLSRFSGYGINTPISLWGANVLPANTSAAQTADDPNHTELFRTTEAGGFLNLGYWYVFSPSDVSVAYRYAFFHKNAADAAANQWGNVCEVTFCGYDDDEAAAAAVIPPESLTAARGTDGIRVAWTRGLNVSGYAIERKVGDGDWTEYAVPDEGAVSLTDAAASLTSGSTYAYRVRVTGSDSLVRYSPVVAVLWYTPGDGTGLLATYSAPSPLASCDPAKTVLGSETVPGIDVTKAAGEALCGTTADNVLVAWKGRLIAPVAGDYAFTVEATDGFMLELDGDVKIVPEKLGAGSHDTSVCSVLNDWCATDGKVTTRTRTGYALTAGEHQIRAWWNPTTGAKACVLKWTLPGATETVVIPTEQLKPAAEPDPETYGADGWRFETVSNTRGWIAQIANNAFAISEADRGTYWPFHHGAFVWKKLSSDSFSIVADVYAPQLFGEYGYLFVSANLNGGACGDGATLMLYRHARWDGVNGRIRKVDGGEDTNLFASPMLVSAPGTTSSNNTDWMWLRIVRDGDRFTLLARHGTVRSGGVREDCPWVTVATYDDTEKRFGKDVFVGFGSTTDNLADRLYQARFLFSNVKVKERKGMTVIFR